jgi:hypothetical protein
MFLLVASRIAEVLSRPFLERRLPDRLLHPAHLFLPIVARFRKNLGFLLETSTELGRIREVRCYLLFSPEQTGEGSGPRSSTDRFSGGCHEIPARFSLRYCALRIHAR